MNATPHHLQAAADAAYPVRVTLRDTDGNEFSVSRLRPQSIILNAGKPAARIVIDILPMLALELSTALRRQAEALMREAAARAESVGGVA